MVFNKLSRITKNYGEIDSTNEEMNRLLEAESLEEGTVIRADYQSAGKGHQGNIWWSEKGKNLLFSILLKPVRVPADKAFYLSRITSLTLIEVLDKHGITAMIKWPNDILAGKRKICGILIENSIIGEMISHSVIGIGLNVNQAEFDPGIPVPTSMMLEKGCHFDMNLLIEDFRSALEVWYRVLLAGELDLIVDAYHSKLFLLGTTARYSDGEKDFTADIQGVLPGGEIELKLEGGELRRYGFKEIEYLD